MNFRLRKRYVAIIITVLIFLVVVGAYAASNENLTYCENTGRDFSTGWSVNGESVSLPYKSAETFRITNKLPIVDKNDCLYVKVRYDSVVAYIDGMAVYSTKDSYNFGQKTNAGCKEISIPLHKTYSNKVITLEVTLHKSLYGTSMSTAKITTPESYALALVRHNWSIIVLIVLFITTGIIETIIAASFIFRGIKVRRQFTFEAMLFAGVFSISAAFWTFTYTRIPAILTGKMTTYSIIGYLSFCVMPLAFVCLLSSMEDNNNIFLHVASKVFAAVFVIEMCLIILGFMDWAQTTLICHVMDLFDILAAALMAQKAHKNADTRYEKRIIVVGNFIFVAVCLMALITYIYNREGGFLHLFLLALMIYVITQISVIINRIGLNAKEEQEYERTQVYAYTDDLTKLGNRRYFYQILENYTKTGVPNNLTIIYLDVNRLKYYNDTFGHDAGDELLMGAAECIKKIFPDDVSCRMGGDEYAIIVDANQAKLQKFITSFKNCVDKWHGKKVEELSVAVGFASIKEYPNIPLTELARLADDRMFTDKKKFYDDTGFERRGTI